MAAGDVVSSIVSVAIGANLVFQPAAGVEYLIIKAGSDRVGGSSPNVCYVARAEIYNGSISSYIANVDDNPKFWLQWKIYIINTRYFRLVNTSGLVAILSVMGIQTK